MFRKLRSRWRSRNIPPAVGQLWNQEGSLLLITNIYDNGRIGMRSPPWSPTYGSWSDSPEEWRDRVRNRGLFLEESSNVKH